MKIDRIQWAVHETPRTEALTITRGTATTATNVLVRLESGNLIGHGSGCPNDVTGETRESVARTIQTLAEGLRGREIDKAVHLADAMDSLLPGNPAAKAAIDIAFHDALATSRGVSLYRWLGGRRTSILTDMTIGIMRPEDAVERARRWVAKGFRALKVKVGLDPVGDVARLQGIRDAVGPDIELRVDGNQGYRYDDAVRVARAMAPLKVAFLEQPLAVPDLNGMKMLAEASPIPIMADEAVLTPQDAMKVRWAGAAKAVNLKLMKHGGIQRAIEVNAVCESAGFPTMVGCMGESVVSIAAALHFALATPSVRWADLDSHFHLLRDAAEPLRFEAGALHAADAPGLGLRFDEVAFG